MEMIKLQPAYKDYLWGGSKLKENYNKKSDLEVVAESWELSNHTAGQSVVENGEFTGKTFGDYLTANGMKVVGTNGEQFEQFPVLIKFIDAKLPLSIQVHPNDDYALRVEKEYGKTEMWYILDCEEEAFLYYGMNQTITREEFKERIDNNTITEVLNKVYVKKGDVFFIEAGTIHAIGAGIQICEIQQNSNTTYRVYDYDRRDANGNPRELHIEKAVEVSDLNAIDTSSNEMNRIQEDGYTYRLLSTCKYFTTTLFEVEEQVALTVGSESFHSYIIIEGTAIIEGNGQILQVNKGDSVFIPANFGQVTVKGNCQFIKTTV